jgi:hypothetical protein
MKSIPEKTAIRNPEVAFFRGIRNKSKIREASPDLREFSKLRYTKPSFGIPNKKEAPANKGELEPVNNVKRLPEVRKLGSNTHMSRQYTLSVLYWGGHVGKPGGQTHTRPQA